VGAILAAQDFPVAGVLTTAPPHGERDTRDGSFADCEVPE